MPNMAIVPAVQMQHHRVLRLPRKSLDHSRHAASVADHEPSLPQPTKPFNAAPGRALDDPERARVG